MDKAKLMNGLSRIDQLIPKPTESIEKSKATASERSLFEKTLEQSLEKTLDKGLHTDGGLAKDKANALGELKKDSALGGLRFSNHAIERMQTRGISYSPDSLTRLEEAVKKAASKGSKDTLVLMDDSALIVSVKNNTVVTVMDKTALKENVFTNIDSTVVI